MLMGQRPPVEALLEPVPEEGHWHWAAPQKLPAAVADAS